IPHLSLHDALPILTVALMPGRVEVRSALISFASAARLVAVSVTPLSVRLPLLLLKLGAYRVAVVRADAVIPASAFSSEAVWAADAAASLVKVMVAPVGPVISSVCGR